MLHVRLYDNRAVNQWADFTSRKLTANKKHETWCRTFFDDTLPGIDQSVQWQQILHTLEELRHHGMHIPFAMRPEWDGQQPTLNFLHRFFTDNLAWHAELAHHADTKNPYDPGFVIPDILRNYDAWRTLLARINMAVHNLENLSAITDNRRFILEHFPLKTWAFVIDIDRTLDAETWLSFDSIDQENNYKYFDDDRPQAILDWSILGKSLLQSFADHDDPCAKDCTGRLGSSGGFFVDIDNNRKLLYKSARFVEWIESYGLDPTRLPLEFPIGWIENPDDWKSLWKIGTRQITSLHIE